MENNNIDFSFDLINQSNILYCTVEKTNIIKKENMRASPNLKSTKTAADKGNAVKPLNRACFQQLNTFFHIINTAGFAYQQSISYVLLQMAGEWLSRKLAKRRCVIKLFHVNKTNLIHRHLLNVYNALTVNADIGGGKYICRVVNAIWVKKTCSKKQSAHKMNSALISSFMWIGWCERFGHFHWSRSN